MSLYVTVFCKSGNHSQNASSLENRWHPGGGKVRAIGWMTENFPLTFESNRFVFIAVWSCTLSQRTKMSLDNNSLQQFWRSCRIFAMFHNRINCGFMGDKFNKEWTFLVPADCSYNIPSWVCLIELLWPEWWKKDWGRMVKNGWSIV